MSALFLLLTYIHPCERFLLLLGYLLEVLFKLFLQRGCFLGLSLRERIERVVQVLNRFLFFHVKLFYVFLERLLDLLLLLDPPLHPPAHFRWDFLVLLCKSVAPLVGELFQGPARLGFVDEPRDDLSGKVRSSVGVSVRREGGGGEYSLPFSLSLSLYIYTYYIS